MAKKLLALLLIMALLLPMTAVLAEAQEPITISYYSTQAGLDDKTVALLGKFMEQNPGITVEYYPCGDDQLAAWLALYSAGTAPTVSMLDVGQILNYSDYMYDLSGETEMLSHVLSGLGFVQKEGSDAIYGIPASYQGFSLIYNKRLVAEVLGEGFDVSAVNSKDKLLAFFDAFDKAGIPPTVVFSADWALGAHYLGCQLYSEWLGDKAAQRAILKGMYTGETKLMDLEHFNNIMDMFDVLKQYNINIADPLADTQEGDLEMVATGKTATMFQGDWNWLQIQTFAERDDMGLMPLPLTNDETDPRNAMILGSCPKAYCVDIYQNSPEQQAAGVKLATWLALSDEGKEFMVKELGSTLPFDNVSVVNENPLAASTQEYLAAGKILDISTYLCESPTDFWLMVGPLMQAYLANQMDRETLASEIEAYFQDI
ncbi:MAG: ABC transporter substrate-binding protein [Oscillospiraceae bacterium]|jgi:raffinose/stachyose/melibiose transport system substrate-binding protein|nr:ABC transporter substrate-binding protein [Oscillospiraceae bacterium]